ncbi:MAG: HAMP domain-containing histidine kinase [Bifidobacteriaceae bacterium]|jgi:signal transduction histidine kinase|nr:HAMP domain-containing histidine kinase [Bifidobacteriaceae bacterium]
MTKAAKRPLPNVTRPLDPFGSIKIKIGVLVTSAVTAAVVMTWLGLKHEMGPTRTMPLAVVTGLVVTQVLAHGMTSPLREMTEAAQAMAKGDYSTKVSVSSRDEVGELARAFTLMAKDLAQTDALRREMIANVSHELRTPVAALQAELENMVDGVTAPDLATLDLLLTQTKRLSRLVTDMLDLSRLDADAMELDPAEVEVEAFLDDAVAAARLVASSAGKQLAFAVEVVPRTLRMTVDPERLHQVAANLLSNAVRHSPDGGIITITATTSGKWIQLDFKDQGPGIAPEDRERIFERFERGKMAGASSAASTGGTGLGLAIARWAVRLHAGSLVVVDSDSGADFRVRLPRSLGAGRGSDRGSDRGAGRGWEGPAADSAAPGRGPRGRASRPDDG